MKYLILAEPSAPIPREMGLGLWQAATEWMNAQIAAGGIDCAYVFADSGGFAISNADSHEQVFDSLLTYPLYGFFDWEVRALCDWSHSYETIIKLYQNLPG